MKPPFSALSGNLILSRAIIFCAVKVVAVSVTMGGRMGGVVFSPSLIVGALLGLSYGSSRRPLCRQCRGQFLFMRLLGMAAVAAAVLGAPISTTLIVFEMTGDWQTGLAVLVTVSLATALSSAMWIARSSLTQLERRNIHVAIGRTGICLNWCRGCRHAPN